MRFVAFFLLCIATCITCCLTLLALDYALAGMGETTDDVVWSKASFSSYNPYECRFELNGTEYLRCLDADAVNERRPPRRGDRVWVQVRRTPLLGRIYSVGNVQLILRAEVP